jgi:hypothetical protein
MDAAVTAAAIGVGGTVVGARTGRSGARVLTPAILHVRD